MNQNEIINNIGTYATVNGYCDLAFEVEMKHIIRSSTKVKILKLTRGCLAYVEERKGKYHSIPPKNLDIVEGNNE